MLTKIEQAIANVLTTNRTPDYHNVLDAYVRLCHPGGPASAIDNPAAIADMLETGLFFERAMDKYPDVGEKVGSQAPFAKWIADFRRSQWQLEIDVATNSMHMPTDAWFRFPCPCCGITGHIDDIRRKLGLLEIEAPREYPLFNASFKNSHCFLLHSCEIKEAQIAPSRR